MVALVALSLVGLLSNITPLLFADTAQSCYVIHRMRVTRWYLSSGTPDFNAAVVVAQRELESPFTWPGGPRNSGRGGHHVPTGGVGARSYTVSRMSWSLLWPLFVMLCVNVSLTFRGSVEMARAAVGRVAASRPAVWVRERYRDWRSPPAYICRTCRYNLTGNESGVCPECGVNIPEHQRRSLVSDTEFQDDLA